MNPSIIWFITGLVLFIVEFALPGVVIAFFGLGAWAVSLILIFVDVSINIQLICFLVISIFSLLFLRSFIAPIFTGSRNLSSSSDDEIIGQIGRAQTAILPDSTGKIELKGTTWTAESDLEVSAGQKVEVISREGLKLFVNPIDMQ